MSQEPQPLSIALAELIALRGFARVRSDDELRSAWQRVAGEELAAQADLAEGEEYWDLQQTPAFLMLFLFCDILA